MLDAQKIVAKGAKYQSAMAKLEAFNAQTAPCAHPVAQQTILEQAKAGK